MIEQYNNKAVFTVTNSEQEPFYQTLAGRNRWSMAQLLEAGKKGCTPIKNQAPQWSAYVFNLRKFPGNHARYVLRAQVEGGAA